MNQSEKLQGLQLARAAAALSIAYFHSWHVTLDYPPETSHPIEFLKNHGWIAVDFFFAISGFVICMITSKAKFSSIKFMHERAYRIYPLWIATSLVFLYLAFHPVGFGPGDSWGFIAYSMTLLPTDGYPFYNVGWSLQHEMAFYLLAALLVPRFGIISLASFLIIAAIIGRLVTLPAALAPFPLYYPNFLAGIAAFVVHRHVRNIHASVFLGLGCLLLWIFLHHIGRPMFPVALFFLLLGFVNIRPKAGSYLERIGVTLGDASYSIYLIHTLLFWYVFWCMRTWFKPIAPVWSQELWRYGSIACVCYISILTWRYFERPWIEFGHRAFTWLEAKHGGTKIQQPL